MAVNHAACSAEFSRRSWPILLLLPLLSTTTRTAAAAAANTPSQIHSHPTGVDGSILVSWSVPAACGASCATIVSYAAVNDTANAGLWTTTAASPLDVTTMDTSMGSAQSWLVISVVLPSLPLNATTYYACGGLGSGAPVLALTPGRLRQWGDSTPTTLPPEFAASPPLRIVAALADMGYTNAYSLPRLMSDSLANRFDSLVFSGDLAYDLSAASGATGDAFMNVMQPIFGQKPMVMGVGNHECDGTLAALFPLRCFSSFVYRFAGVARATGASSGSNTNMWYSVDDVGAGIHYVVVSSELWSYTGSAANITAQYVWLQNDLMAVNRTRTPWVIALSHKQTWQDSTNMLVMERILNAGRVDLVFIGHQHNAARLYPLDNYAGSIETGCVSGDLRFYRDCANMTTLLVGAPGNVEALTVNHPTAGAAK